MKALRLTWLHSCPLGGRRHDYRAERVLPPLLAWTNTLFKETEWTRDERAGSPGPQLLLLFCWCCLLYRGCRLFNRCYLQGLRDLYVLLLFRITRLYIGDAGLEPEVFHVSPHTLSQQPHLCALSSGVNSLTATFQQPESTEFKVSCEKWVFWRENTLNWAFKLHQSVSEIIYCGSRKRNNIQSKNQS